MGYPFGKKGWRLYDLESKVFFVFRDVKFIEDVFPFATPEDVYIESHGFELPYDTHDDFVEYEEYIDNVVHDVYNGDSEDTSGVGDPATASPPDETASA